jgi:hypothetical protein
MIDCTINVLTPIAIDEKEYGRRLFSVLFKHFPAYAPQRYGDFEPLRHRFSPTNVELALECWGRHAYMTESQEPRVSMMASFAAARGGARHSSVNFFDFQLSDADELPAIKDFVQELSEVFVADYAMAHVFTRNELEDCVARVAKRQTSWPEPPAEQLVARMRSRIEREGYTKVLWGAEVKNLNTLQLSKCLPNLYWLNVFGPPYVDVFGTQCLLDAPSESVQILPYGGISIELTKDLPDTAEAWGAFKAARARCRSHLDSNVFCEPTALKDHHYKTPQFAFRTRAGAH